MVGSMGWMMTVILRILTTEYFRWGPVFRGKSASVVILKAL
jgi:hypothetical protein